MASPVALIALISLVLFAGITEARKDTGEYWQGVAARNDQALLEHLVRVDSTLSDTKKITTASDCHTSNKKDSVAEATNNKKSVFATDFEPRPNLSAYGDDAKLKKEGKTFTKDFEPRPGATFYAN
ncbi:unnamed protein product [Coffea canephora]|uniref:Organ-specific protein S2-like n=3 Tax=Coffea TaxID=13442 RepID=A0A068TL57_COFCA|nr:unnamed protein product [Coffea canephora]